MNVVDVKTNLTLGGNYKIQLSKPDGTVFSIEGEYIEIEKPNMLKISFRYVGIDNNPPDSIVSITLKKVGENASELSLVQEFELIPADMANRTKAWEYMVSVLNEKILIANIE